MKMQITESLLEFYNRHGYITINGYRNAGITPSVEEIINEFRSWKKALIAAGLNESVTHSRYSKEDVILAIQNFNKQTGSIKLKLYNQTVGKPSSSTINFYFGSWKNALCAAGILTEDTKKECIISITEIHSQYGFINEKTYEESGAKPSVDIIKAHFGSWKQALIISGVSKEKKTSKKITKSDCILAIEQFILETGSISSYRYIQSRRSPSLTLINDLLGSWKQALNEISIDLTPYREPHLLHANSSEKFYEVEPFKHKKNYSKGEAIESIRLFIKRHGTINRNRYRRAGYLPVVSTIEKLWGSWDLAIAAAGAENKIKISKDDCLKSLIQCYSDNGRISVPIYKAGKYEPSYSTIASVCGSWKEALLEAGLVQEKIYSRSDCITSIKSFYKTYNSIESSVYTEKGGIPDLNTIITKFGSWENALKSAGLMEKKDKCAHYTLEDCLQALRNFHSQYGKTSSRVYRTSDFLPSYAYITKNFGSWNHVLQMAGINPDTPSNPKV